MNPPPQDGIVRISREEATSAHVDDLLKRQMSLRGEPGVTRDHGRKWCYQNWFVFMIVGALGALSAWALLEPVFDDFQYLQGPIEAVRFNDTLPRSLEREGGHLALDSKSPASIIIKGTRIHMLAGARELLPHGDQQRLSLDTLENGQVVGIYLRHFELATEDISLGQFLVRSPPPQDPDRASLSVGQLAARSRAAALLLLPLVAAMIGLFIGAADGVICRLPRRAIFSGLVGLLLGFVGGFIFGYIAELVYAPFTQLAIKQGGDGIPSLSTFGFVLQMLGRSLAWSLAGLAMGIGQGIALRSKQLLIYGLLGGVVGGLLGGLLFDPIDLILLGPDKPSAHWSRLIGFLVIGASVGGMIGVVELLARDAWLRMTQGPLTGKEFLIFKDVMNIGSSPRSDIYLFNDPLVAENHATIRAVGDECEIEARQSLSPVLINNRSTQRARLRHGDNVTVGRTVFVFQRRKG